MGVDCLYGDGELRYIGETGLDSSSTIVDQVKSHLDDHLAGRWDKFSWFGRLRSSGDCGITLALQQVEAISIAILNPGFNRQAGTFADAVQVHQESHPESHGDLEDSLDRIENRLRAMAAPSRTKT